jgi:HSP20 family protein
MYGKYTVFDDMMNVARGFDRAFGRSTVPATRRQAFVPAVESYEKDRNLVLRVEIPGVDPSEVEVTVKDGRLTLKGEKKEDRTEEKANVYLRETYHGKFERAFALPEDVNGDAIEASYKNGVLEITVPRAELPQPRRIEVLTDGSESKKDEKAA